MGLFAGFLVGFMINNGDNYYTKKKDRIPIGPDLVLVFGAMGGVVEMFVGFFVAGVYAPPLFGQRN